MDSVIASRTSILNLAKGLVGEMKTFVRQEFELFKTELSEKLSSMGRNAVSLAIGGFIAYAGLLVFLVGLGWLLAYAFTAAGMSQFIATFLGMAVIGLLVMLFGAAFIGKAVSSLKNESLAPERSLQTLQELKGSKAVERPKPEREEPRRSSEELQNEVEQTEQEMGETLDELGRRLSPSHINQRIKHQIQERPYRAGLIAMGAGVLSGMMVRRKFQRA